MTTCTDCGRSLKRIHVVDGDLFAYVRPDYSRGYMSPSPEPRPPLCKGCWKKATKKAEGKLK
jgi:hypothetical protein